VMIDVLQWSVSTMVRCLSATVGETAGFWVKGIKSTLSFLQRNSHVVVILLETLCALLCIDLLLSSYLLRRRPQSRGKSSSSVESGSLLRKAKNLKI
jgi:hypothetical protein